MKNETYEEFIEKFKPKLTTDDCMTPPAVYEAVKKWACEEYSISPDRIVRPFWPGGDYVHFDYPDGCVVLDNPPFSILSKILEFYLDRGISFFLFAPALTAFSGKKSVMRTNHIIPDASIIYENGAVVRTAFITSFDSNIIAQSAPALRRRIEAAMKSINTAKSTPRYEYPDYVLTSAMLQKLSKYDVEYKVSKKDAAYIKGLDEQRLVKKAVYGGGLLLSEKAAAEKAAAEKAAAEKAAAILWKLTDREMEIIKSLG